MTHKFQPNDQVWWHGQLVTIRSLPGSSEGGTMYIVEDAEGVFFRARPELLIKAEEGFRERTFSAPQLRRAKENR